MVFWCKKCFLRVWDGNIWRKDATDIRKSCQKLVKEKTYDVALNYLLNEQLKGSKCADIKYKSIELQYYLNPFANIKLEEQIYIFSLRIKVNSIIMNFSKDKTMMIT